MKTQKSTSEKVFNRYHYYATQAVEAEQNGKFKHAIKQWEVAKLSATGGNVAWCEARIAHCKYMLEHPSRWSK